MTNLELILIGILWIGYGIFSAFQKDLENPEGYREATYIFMTMFSPVILVYRILMGVLHSKIFRL